MQYATGVITDGFKQLLNGRMKPSAVVNAFQHETPEVFHVLREVPSTAGAYIEADPEARQRWAWLIDYIRQKADDDPDALIRNIYSSAFYKLDYSLFPPFHILSLYYRTVIYCESRMILCHLEYWLNELELSLLKYEYYNLKYHLIDLLLRVDQPVGGRSTGMDKVNTNHEELIDQLEQYLKQLLRETLIVLLLELSRRYEHLLEDPPITEEKLITEDKIYLEYLERPVPASFPWYITCAGVKNKLKVLQPSKDYLQKIVNLLTDVRKQMSAVEGEAARAELNNASTDRRYLVVRLFNGDAGKNAGRIFVRY
ncbi:MAG: hypothetical protein WD604_09420 [Balneolaceae bacterium]